jgi:hypothetical protein
LEFNESYKFDFSFANYDKEALDRACFWLFMMAGVSYFKAYLAPNIVIDRGFVTDKEASFFENTYQKGLGELFYRNNLDPKTSIVFPVTKLANKPKIDFPGAGKLIAIGGGKDSLVSFELLRNSQEEISTWSLDHRSQLEPLIKTMDTDHYYVERVWDRKLLEINEQDAFNGHIPISAIFGLVGVIVAILTGKKDIVFSNEQSADEENLEYRGVSINHQFSKTSEFEKSLQNLIENNFRQSLRYYSFLRPLGELYISKIFGEKYFDKYKAVFSSCNNSFNHTSNAIFWCGKCPKCAFIFLALTPFVDKTELEKIFGRNILLDDGMNLIYKELIGISGNKPLDCVGEIKESRMAMRFAQKIYPHLSKFDFYIPDDYNYKQIRSHYMPEEIFKLLIGKI